MSDPEIAALRARSRAEQEAQIQTRRANPDRFQVGDRQRDTGKHQLHYPDGSVTNRGTKVSDAQVTGQTLPGFALASGAIAVVGPKGEPSPLAPLEPGTAGDRSQQRNPATPLKDACIGRQRGQAFTCAKPEPQTTNIKYLYSVIQSGKLRFYVGGWQKKSVLAAEFPADTPFVPGTGIATVQFRPVWGNVLLDNLSGDRFLVNFGATSQRLLTTSGKTPTEITNANLSTAQLACGFGFWTCLDLDAFNHPGNIGYWVRAKPKVFPLQVLSIDPIEGGGSFRYVSLPGPPIITTSFGANFNDARSAYRLYRMNRTGTAGIGVHEYAVAEFRFVWFDRDGTHDRPAATLTFSMESSFVDVQGKGFTAIIIPPTAIFTGTSSDKDIKLRVNFHDSTFKLKKFKTIKVHKPDQTGDQFTLYNFSYA